MNWRKSSKIKYPYTNGYKGYIYKPYKHKSWSNDRYSTIKKAIKKHYSIVQNDVCAYCRFPINYGGYGEAIEHIVPKSDKPKWMFHPENLCLACYGCNTKKSTKNTLKHSPQHYGDKYNDYPVKSGDFIIMHPHFESFSSQLIEDKLIIKPNPKGTKGEETIKICGLNRFDLLNKRARKNRLSRLKMKQIAVSTLSDPIATKNEKLIAQDLLTDLIERYKYLRKIVK